MKLSQLEIEMLKNAVIFLYKNLKFIIKLILIKYLKQIDSEGEVCSEECSSAGCWGKGSDQCLECKNFIYKGTCLPSCKSTKKYEKNFMFF